MRWFLNLATRSKLFSSFALVIVLLAVVIATAYRGITTVQASQKALYREEFMNALDLIEIRSQQNAARADMLSIILLPQRSDQDAVREEVKRRAKEAQERTQQLLERNRRDPQLFSKLQGFDALRADYRDTRDNQIIPLIYAGKIEETKKLVFGIQAERDAKMRSIADELVNQSEKQAATSVAQSEQITAEYLRIFLIVGLSALLLGLAMAGFLSRIIASPLQAITIVAETVASGDLSVNVPMENRDDEVGVLAQAFNRMMQSLQGMARVAGQISAGDLTMVVKPQSSKDVLGNAFAAMVESLRRVNREIRGGVNVLASSAGEILATTTQVAAGAAETATAVSQTTSTVEELKQTAQVSSQKARHVSESAQKSAQASHTGKKSVEETLQGMNRIREQMELIAESIVRLSEQGQAIGEIMAAVNDLAEQSNLLAVNAAIEAAKAGDQGKGFAVVAQEVRSLAEQSKQATAQVRTILSDLQKATSAAVMASEQGSKAVEAGVKQSTEAGDSIRVLADSMAEAAQAATQIAASSQQQLVGMDQVALAMESIKQASVQNVTGTKQGEAAAQNLHGLGQKLRQLVEQYQV